MPRNQAVESQYSTQNPVPKNSVDEAWVLTGFDFEMVRQNRSLSPSTVNQSKSYTPILLVIFWG
jgi:hypothetical protein